MNHHAWSQVKSLGRMSFVDFRPASRTLPRIAIWGLRAHILLGLASLAVVVGLGLYLRTLSAREMPFNEDEYATALQTIGILKTGKPTLPSGWVQWSEPVALPYLVSFVWKMTGPAMMVGRLASVAVGTLSILAGYA